MAIKPISFEKRRDLSGGEKDAVRRYRDLNYHQNKWSLRISGRRQKDCDVINSCLRNPDMLASLKSDEVKLFTSLVDRITMAIRKSTVSKTMIVYKGLHDFPELENFEIGTYVSDFGFNSFSTSIKTAKTYSDKNKDGEYIYFMLVLKKDSHALYIDAKEHEWLLQRGVTYYISNIRHVNNRIFKKAIIYYLVV